MDTEREVTFTTHSEDGELQAIEIMMTLLNQLPPGAAMRVIGYVQERAEEGRG